MTTFYAQYPAIGINNVTATNDSIGPTGSPVPTDATYVGMNVSGNLVGLTGTANGLKVDGSATSQPIVFQDSTATGSITSTQSVSISTVGFASVGVQVSGTWTGTLFTEWSPDGSTWYNTTWLAIQTGAQALTFTTNNAGTIQCSGAAAVRVRGGTVGSGTANIYLRANVTTAQVMIDNPLPAGSNTIGAVTQASGPWTQNITQFGSTNISTGTGTGGAGIPRVTVSSDSSLASVTTVSTVSAVTAISNALPSGTNILGRVGIDQTTPGTTNAIQATSGLTCTWQAEGSIAFGSITNSYQTIFTPAANTKILYMRNNTNASISVSMDAGSTLNFVLDAGDQVCTDLVANGLKCTTANIQIKYTVGAPTSGSFRVNGVS